MGLMIGTQEDGTPYPVDTPVTYHGRPHPWGPLCVGEPVCVPFVKCSCEGFLNPNCVAETHIDGIVRDPNRNDQLGANTSTARIVREHATWAQAGLPPTAAAREAVLDKRDEREERTHAERDADARREALGCTHPTDEPCFGPKAVRDAIRARQQVGETPSAYRPPPGHYSTGTGIDPWAVWDAFDLDRYTANAVKYLLRAGKKDIAPRLEDLKKARDYVNKAIEREELK